MKSQLTNILNRDDEDVNNSGKDLNGIHNNDNNNNNNHNNNNEHNNHDEPIVSNIL